MCRRVRLTVRLGSVLDEQLEAIGETFQFKGVVLNNCLFSWGAEGHPQFA